MSSPKKKTPENTTLARFVSSQKREAKYMVAELLAVRGLMPLLMKSRNGNAWSAEEKAELVSQLRRLSRLSPYLLFLLLPGSALILPAYAWWLDRRRGQREGDRENTSLPDSQRP